MFLEVADKHSDCVVVWLCGCGCRVCRGRQRWRSRAPPDELQSPAASRCPWVLLRSDSDSNSAWHESSRPAEPRAALPASKRLCCQGQVVRLWARVPSPQLFSGRMQAAPPGTAPRRHQAVALSRGFTQRTGPWMSFGGSAQAGHGCSVADHV